MIKKPGLAKKSKSPKDKAHLNWVASNPCCVCGSFIVQVHHIRHFGEARDDKRTIPLCWNHHLGPDGFHTLGKKVWPEKYGYELDMLKKLNETLTDY